MRLRETSTGLGFASYVMESYGSTWRVDAVFGYRSDRTWERFAPNAPNYVNTLDVLAEGTAYWFVLP